jgi:hypothetical protein
VGRGIGGIAVAVALAIAWLAPVSGASAVPAAWKVVSTPDLGAHTVLHSVACADATTCFAVGSSGSGTSSSSVIASWDGKSWTRAQHPRLGRDELMGVSCASASWCVAVGDYQSATNQVTLVETWDGTRWALAPSPNPSWFGNQLLSVSCSSLFRCAAVGSLSDMHGYVYPIALDWNGFEWSVGNPPYEGILVPNVLAGVSCSSDTRCVAVGSTEDDSQQFTALVDRWNSKKWSNEPVPQPDATSRALAGIACSSVARCVAVGQEGAAALVERRDSTGWSLEPSAHLSAAFVALSGVACPSASRCLAVGGVGADARHQKPLIESARGSTWSRVTAPATGGDDTLASVACASTIVCFAVGTTTTGGHPAPLVLTGPS